MSLVGVGKGGGERKHKFRTHASTNDARTVMFAGGGGVGTETCLLPRRNFEFL